MDLHNRYPAIADLKRRAKRRIPHFVWEYLDSATGTESTPRRNRAALDAITLRTSILHGDITPDTSTTLLGQSYPLPIGIAPVGMSGLIWPQAERHLARFAARTGLPYAMSTVAAATPEQIGPHAGNMGWFQLYPPRDPDILSDMLTRIRNAGFKTLILTVDVPAPSRRERQTRSGLTQPPRLTPRLLAQVARCPAWAAGTLRTGMPRMRFVESYATNRANLPSTAHIGYLLRTSPDWGYLNRLRDAWDGPLIIKGVLNPDDAARLSDSGADALWISNHAGRQFDAAAASITALPAIRAATNLPLILDGGIDGGLDAIRALALGADFVMMGRAWHYALGALGESGPGHLESIMKNDIIANMHQLGAQNITDLQATLPEKSC